MGTSQKTKVECLCAQGREAEQVSRLEVKAWVSYRNMVLQRMQQKGHKLGLRTPGSGSCCWPSTALWHWLLLRFSVFTELSVKWVHFPCPKYWQWLLWKIKKNWTKSSICYVFLFWKYKCPSSEMLKPQKHIVKKTKMIQNFTTPKYILLVIFLPNYFSMHVFFFSILDLNVIILHITFSHLLLLYGDYYFFSFFF